MKYSLRSTCFALGALLIQSGVQVTHADGFQLSSTDIKAGETLSSKHVFSGFGCKGDNASPQLSWKNPPKGTKSFAVTAYDPDAPTGSGWWHWQVVNIPSSVSSLPTHAGNANNKTLPKGSQQMKNDYSQNSFGGACPPKGHGAHRYQFTVYALSVETLELPKQPSAALVGYMIKANALGSASLEALYERK